MGASKVLNILLEFASKIPIGDIFLIELKNYRTWEGTFREAQPERV